MGDFMFDCHYDLLTYIYMNKNNLKNVKTHCKEIFKRNITGGIFNLFYMSKEEMERELGIKEKDINILQNLKDVEKLIKEFNLIPQNINYVYGVEGLDYLDNINDVSKLYDLGVRSVNIVWNNDNKFGGGVKGNNKRGLTSLGKELVEKLVDTNIAIDLSHANEKTFYDIINICTNLKNTGKIPKVFASHSNSKSICNNIRNLSDDQIIKIKELNGLIGVVSVKPFCIQEKRLHKCNLKYEKAYIEHIKYIKKLLNGVENIAVSTDDMTYYKISKRYYKHFNVFKQNKMKKRLEKLLSNDGFKQDEIEKILNRNAQEFLFNNAVD